MSQPESLSTDRRLALLLIVLALAGCSKVPAMVDGRILTDKDGCAFIAARNVGDNLFLRRMKELDKDTCKLGDDK
jgi:hypothetical protein